MKNTIKKLFVVCLFLLFSSFNFVNAIEFVPNYGDSNMYVVKQGKVVIVNSSNNDIRIGFIEEGYTMYQYDSSGLFTRNVAFQIRDFDDNNGAYYPADILYKDLKNNSNWYNNPKTNNDCEFYIRLFDENDAKMYWVEMFIDESEDYIDINVKPTLLWEEVIELSESQINYILQLSDIESFNSYVDVTNVKSYKYGLDSTISNLVLNNVTVPAGYYFSNLKENFPTNTVGSCGYIATEILLSYYDIFYNSDICPEQAYGEYMITSVNVNSYDLRYCLNSPGPSESFNQMMIDSVAPYAGIQNSETDLALTYNEMILLLNKFMQSFSDYSYNYNYQVVQLSTLDDILAELDLGRPVILTMEDYAFEETIQINQDLVDTIHCFYDSPHATVIYGYEEMSSGEVFFKCHTGYKSSAISNITSVSLKLLSNSYQGISLQLINNVHSHSNVYIYGNSFCPCINDVNYSEYCLLNDQDVDVVLNNEIWIMKREEEGNI